ncbi:MAG: 50S ribosome-binding GTPase, partial [Phycisphaerae bacterium]|nr:50S ribosome-binding GTPase [Phycisphaerae bacterium]
PGTTRDAVDIRFEKDGMAYVAIDTAGVRKKSSVSSDIEFYSIARAEAAIRRANATLLLIDAVVPISKVDKHLARYVADQAKPCVLVVNKWDLAAGKANTGEYADYLLRELPGVKYAPVAFTTATQGRNVESAIDLARSLFKQASLRVSTSKLNQALRDAVERHRPPSPRGARLRIYYATQVSTCPPTIVFFVNNPDLVAQQYSRYLENRLRETLSFGEVPLRFHFRARRREKR